VMGKCYCPRCAAERADKWIIGFLAVVFVISVGILYTAIWYPLSIK